MDHVHTCDCGGLEIIKLAFNESERGLFYCFMAAFSDIHPLLIDEM